MDETSVLEETKQCVLNWKPVLLLVADFFVAGVIDKCLGYMYFVCFRITTLKMATNS